MEVKQEIKQNKIKAIVMWFTELSLLISINCVLQSSTVTILSFWTDRSGQTVQTQIRLLLEEQSDQGLHCLLFNLHLFDNKPSALTSLFEFLVNYSKATCVRKFRNFTVVQTFPRLACSRARNFNSKNVIK